MAKPMRYGQIITEIQKCKPRTICEIGTWNGHNAVKMMKAAKAFHSSVHYYGYDLFEDFTETEYEYCPKTPALKAAVIKLFNKNKINNFKLVQGNTRETLKNLSLPFIDFIYMDGGHSLETIANDWLNIQTLIHPATVIILDDYYEDFTEKGCKFLIDGLHRRKWNVTKFPSTDVTNDGFNVSLTKVTCK